ncbi:MAG: hypothetical protein LBI26_02145 [Holosporales bacterium]|jgi:hypothetical protein|nr:hypothetical protein [Holosporales bacterium]
MSDNYDDENTQGYTPESSNNNPQQYQNNQGYYDQNYVNTQPEVNDDFAKYWGETFKGTPAAGFGKMEDLGHEYNDLMAEYNELNSVLGSRLDKLTSSQKDALINSLGINAPVLPKDSNEYRIPLHLQEADPELLDQLQDGFYKMGLSVEQGNEISDFIENYTDSLFSALSDKHNETSLQYVELTKQCYGDNLAKMADNADYAMETVIPEILDVSSDKFLTFLERHGIYGHPFIFALLAELGEIYNTKSSPPTPFARINSNKSRNSQKNLNLEELEIMGNPDHPLHKKIR